MSKIKFSKEKEVPLVSVSKKALKAHYNTLEPSRPLSSASSLKPHLLTPSLIGRPPISNISAKTKLKTMIAPAAINQQKNRDVVLKLILRKPFALGDGTIIKANDKINHLAFKSTGKMGAPNLKLPKESFVPQD